MARPAAANSNADTRVFNGTKLAPLKIIKSLQDQPLAESADQTAAPLTHLESLWHFECVVSPRSPAALLRSPSSSPRSRVPPHGVEAGSASISPGRSPVISPRAAITPSSSPHAAKAAISPRSPAAKSSTSSPSSLSRFASADCTSREKVLQRVFSTFDENGDGRVSIHEISSIFQRLGIPNSEYSIQSLLARLVTKCQGHVDEHEFLQLYDTVCSFVEELDASASSSSVDPDVDQDLLAAFHVFDKDGNGFISPTELQSVLCSLGFPQARQLDACVDMIARVDENGDGHVDFLEFKKLFHLENPFMDNSIQSF